jgi:outer membrane usher protein
MSARAVWRCPEPGSRLNGLARLACGALHSRLHSFARAALQCLAVPCLLLSLLLLLLLLLSEPALANSGPEGEPQPPGTEAVVVGLVLNGTVISDNQLLHRELKPGRRIWLPESELPIWRLSTGGRDKRNIQNLPHVAYCDRLDRCDYDESAALVTMRIAAADLTALRFTRPLPTPVTATKPDSVGGFLNYDITAVAARRISVASWLEAHVYTPQGQGMARLANVTSSGASTRTLSQAVWQIDKPERGLSYQAGSINSPDTGFAVGLPMTGLRVGSNSRLQPGLVNMSLPQMTAQADRALRADVFVDGLFRQNVQVPYGPYTVDVLPQYPGRGTMDLLSTDISGRQTRITMPYYLTPNVLSSGVRIWSADLGVLADDGRQLAGPKPVVLSLALRDGLDGKWTPQLQALVSRGSTRWVLAGDTANPQWGASSLSLIGQRSPSVPRGALWLGLAQDYQSRDVNLGFRLEHALRRGTPQAVAANADSSLDTSTSTSTNTSTLTPAEDRLARPLSQFSATAGANLSGGWSLNAALDVLRADSATRRESRALSLRYSAGARSQLALTVQRSSINGRSQSSVLLSWSQPLGNNYAGQVGLARSGNGTALQWSAQSVPPPDSATATSRQQSYGSLGPHADLGVRWTDRNAAMDWRAEALARREGAFASVGASGAVGLAEGRFFTARRIDDAFIVVDVGLPDLPVLLDNREVARTNSDGWALVTEARAHQSNNVGIDISALPIQYAMPRDQLSVVPASGSAVRAVFDVSDGGIALPVTDARGKPIPVGVLARISTQRLPTAVTSKSEIYLDRSDRAARVQLQWADQDCGFDYRPQDANVASYACVAK